jgi:hypothetical protein
VTVEAVPALTTTNVRFLFEGMQRRLQKRASQRTIASLFPDEGPYARHLYARHLEFFRAGAGCRQRLFLAANRVGKSVGGCYEDALHLTGLYARYAPWAVECGRPALTTQGA